MNKTLLSLSLNILLLFTLACANKPLIHEVNPYHAVTVTVDHDDATNSCEYGIFCQSIKEKPDGKGEILDNYQSYDRPFSGECSSLLDDMKQIQRKYNLTPRNPDAQYFLHRDDSELNNSVYAEYQITILDRQDRYKITTYSDNKAYLTYDNLSGEDFKEISYSEANAVILKYKFQRLKTKYCRRFKQ